MRKHYHIAHILPWSSVGGTEHATLRIAKAVAGAAFRHTIFVRDESSPAGNLFASAGFTTINYQPIEPSYRRPKNFLRAAFALAREMKRRRIELVHCADILAAHYTALAGRLAGVPVLCHVRNRYEEISRRDQTFLYPVDKFAFVSLDTWRRFAYRVKPERGVVVYDGIDVPPPLTEAEAEKISCEVRREFGMPEKAKIVGMVARVAPQKDYTTLARAARHVVAAHPDVRFLIVGDYAQAASNRQHYEEVRRVLSANNVDSHFIFTGLRSDVPRLIRAFDIFILSTHWEGLPLVILEAMAEAKPVVATAVDGIPEIVLDGQTGLLHRHGDDGDLVAQILSLLQRPELMTKLGGAGQQFVKTNFSHEQFAASMARLYYEMLEGPRRTVGTTSEAGLLHHA